MDNTATFFFNKRNYFNYKLLANLVTFILLLITAVVLGCASAATQGKLGKSSTASIGISVHVSQSLTAISPKELLLDQTANKKKPFCVMHHGYKLNSTVPYELIVDEIKAQQNQAALTVPNQTNSSEQSNEGTLPFKIFLENDESVLQKQLLSQGMSFYNQSKHNFNEQANCQDEGVNLSLEMANQRTDAKMQDDLLGVMILLVSPN